MLSIPWYTVTHHTLLYTSGMKHNTLYWDVYTCIYIPLYLVCTGYLDLEISTSQYIVPICSVCIIYISIRVQRTQQSYCFFCSFAFSVLFEKVQCIHCMLQYVYRTLCILVLHILVQIRQQYLYSMCLGHFAYLFCLLFLYCVCYIREQSRWEHRACHHTLLLYDMQLIGLEFILGIALCILLLLWTSNHVYFISTYHMIVIQQTAVLGL